MQSKEDIGCSQKTRRTARDSISGAGGVKTGQQRVDGGELTACYEGSLSCLRHFVQGLRLSSRDNRKALKQLLLFMLLKDTHNVKATI